jgi:chemotaxis protein MotB
MMAFFMLMWLLNATTEVQRTGLADYFAPTNLFGRSASGSGKPFGGKTPNDQGTSVSSDGTPQVITGHQSPQLDVDEDPTVNTMATPVNRTNPQTDQGPDHGPDQGTDQGTGQGTDQATDQRTNLGASRTANDDDNLGQASRDGARAGAAIQAGTGREAMIRGGDYAAARLTPEPNRDKPADPAAVDVARRQAAAIQSDADREQRAMDQAAAQLMSAIRHDPALQDATGQILVDSVPEGLRIQVVDAEHQPMFALGSAIPTARVKELMQKVVPALAGLPNAISIAGHTDSLTYRGQEKGNWELSTDRANATRRILMEAGLADERIRSVTGNADRDLLVPADPTNPANRRITIVVLRHATRAPQATGAQATGAQAMGAQAMGGRTAGPPEFTPAASGAVFATAAAVPPNVAPVAPFGPGAPVGPPFGASKTTNAAVTQ